MNVNIPDELACGQETTPWEDKKEKPWEDTESVVFTQEKSWMGSEWALFPRTVLSCLRLLLWVGLYRNPEDDGGYEKERLLRSAVDYRDV